jgi:hypothetical protein
VSLTVVAATSLPAQLRREIYADLSGGDLGDLTSSPKYHNQPDRLETMTNLDSARDVGDKYGSRVRALLVPPATGQYRFWLASDDAGALKLSTDSTPASLTTIASLADGTYSNPNQWTKFASQTSAYISLVAGQKYYLEVLQKEDGGGDFLVRELAVDRLAECTRDSSLELGSALLHHRVRDGVLAGLRIDEVIADFVVVAK